VTFGSNWTRTLIMLAGDHEIDPEWVLYVLNLESGFDPKVLQGHAKLVVAAGPNDKRPEVARTGGLRLSHGTGARGLFQKMPKREQREGKVDLLYLYMVDDPVAQLMDAFAFWDAMMKQMKVAEPLTSREAFYCLNLAPARLYGGKYSPETVVYSSRKDLHSREYWLKAYEANSNLDKERKGWIEIRDLGPALDRAARSNPARFEAELDALRNCSDGSPTDVG
jgi:hypothetical protein